MDQDPDPGGPKTCGSGGSGSGSATLPCSKNIYVEVNKKHVLLMDEVDGMAGNEDFGGLIEESFIFGRYFVARTFMCR